MYSDRLDSLAADSGGQLISGRPDTLIHGLYSDTRTPSPGGLFVALRGEHFDGNSFARDAIERLGASAVLIDSAEIAACLPTNVGVILVHDTREGYLNIAARFRERISSSLWVGVTGSVGKSSTKEMISHIFENGTGWKIHKAKGSFNNAVGLSHTILNATDKDQAVVLELGTNHPGEIRQLTAVARPNIAVITCAAASHLEAFETVANVAAEKSCILSFQSPHDIAVLNADDPHFQSWCSIARGKILSFGTHSDAHVQGYDICFKSDGCADFKVRWINCIENKLPGSADVPPAGPTNGTACHRDAGAPGEYNAYENCSLRIPGMHSVRNALAALAVAIAAGIELRTSVISLGSFEGIARRFSVKQVRGITLIDDAYNANPASFVAALETMKTLKARRRFVIAGDMLELGPKADEYHRELGRLLPDYGIHALMTVGPLAKIAGMSAVEQGLAHANWTQCSTPEEAAAFLKPMLRDGDAVLIKGSHGIHLERAYELLCRL